MISSKNSGKYINSPLGLILVILVIILLLPMIANLLPVIRFSEESIDVQVFPDEIRVRGLYSFKNPFPFSLSQTFSYTPAEDVDLPEALEVKARKISPKIEPLPFTNTMGSRRFKLRFAAKETVTIEIEYRQKTPKHYARYIPITLKHRNRPLQFGSYALIPRGVEIVSSSYPLRENGSGVQFYEGHRFIHSSQWRFSWRVQEEPPLLTHNEDADELSHDGSDPGEEVYPDPLASFRVP
ncbi:MAG: hypothetical protein ACOCWY_06355 [Thermodesulfobacteriota bacterium]